MTKQKPALRAGSRRLVELYFCARVCEGPESFGCLDQLSIFLNRGSALYHFEQATAFEAIFAAFKVNMVYTVSRSRHALRNINQLKFSTLARESTTATNKGDNKDSLMDFLGWYYQISGQVLLL